MKILSVVTGAAASRTAASSSRSSSPLRSRPMLVALLALALLGGCMAALLIDGSSSASAALGVPAYFGEFGSEVEEVNSVASSPTSGDVYVAAGGYIGEYTPYGQPILAFGGGVDATKLELHRHEEEEGEPVTVTPEEEDICLASSGDTCRGDRGSAGGYLAGTDGVAVAPASGDVYVVDENNLRVERFDSSGHFQLAFGRDVNVAKTEAVKAKEEAGETPSATELQEADLCSAAEACQAGRSGSGEGALGSLPYLGDIIAIGGPAEDVYVGDPGSVQVYDRAGELKEEVSLAAVSATASVTQLAVDSAGDLFFVQQGVAGVHEIETGGVLSANEYDTTSTSVTGLALNAGGSELYVGDGSGSYSVRGYEVARPAAEPIAFAGAEPGEVYVSHGLAVDSAGTVEIAAARGFVRREGKRVSVGRRAVVLYGSLAEMEAAYGPPPPLAPTVHGEAAKSEPGASTATLLALVDPELRATTYQFQYGTEPCSQGGCTDVPAAAASLGSIANTESQVEQTISGLELDRVYHYRLVATNAAGATDGQESVFAIGASPSAGATGLPDGRIYEQVSPANKSGNFVDFINPEQFGLAEANGEAVLYPMSGGTGEATTGTISEYVSHRGPGGWSTSQALPRQDTRAFNLFNQVPNLVVPSSSFDKFLFESVAPYVQGDLADSLNIFLSEDPRVAPDWISRPLVANPVPGLGEAGYTEDYYAIAGATPELGTVYFGYAGTLLPEDSGRAAHIGSGQSTGATVGTDQVHPWGLYEWSHGALSEAGQLPDGSLSQWGAIPAASGLSSDDRTKALQAGNVDNGVTEDEGVIRAYFVSPDPIVSTVSDAADCKREKAECTTQAPELYVRETLSDGSHRVSLVSHSELPGHSGEAAATGPADIQDPTHFEGPSSLTAGTYVYVSPDGKHAFFASVDRLTSDAPEGTHLKEYEYDATTGALTYLPDLNGAIAATTNDGSEALFMNTVRSPQELELWRAGAGGGSVTEVAELPPLRAGNLAVRDARVSTDGSILAFETNSSIPGGFNNGGEEEESNSPALYEVYRYDTESRELQCVSCAPAGVTPTGSAYMSYDDPTEQKPTHGNGAGSDPQTTLETRGMSANGQRIFFDTPSSLVPQDTNGARDIYEWEEGRTYLISAGTSTEDSFFLDSSESGDDVFFATSSGLAPGDADESYDLYDARVPRPGDVPPPVALPCKGSVCQGPPSMPQLLGAPASETFSGLGDVALSRPSHEGMTRGQKLAAALKRCRHEKAGKRRRACRRQARRRYGGLSRLAAQKRARHARAGRDAGAEKTRHHNGRGK